MADFPALSKPPSVPMDPDGQIDDGVLRSNAEAGYEQTRPRFTRARRSWGVNYKGLPNADVATLRSFERVTLHWGADAFAWTHPLGDGTFTVRLTGPMRFSRPSTGVTADVSFTIKEV